MTTWSFYFKPESHTLWIKGKASISPFSPHPTPATTFFPQFISVQDPTCPPNPLPHLQKSQHDGLLAQRHFKTSWLPEPGSKGPAYQLFPEGHFHDKVYLILIPNSATKWWRGFWHNICWKFQLKNRILLTPPLCSATTMLSKLQPTTAQVLLPLTPAATAVEPHEHQSSFSFLFKFLPNHQRESTQPLILCPHLGLVFSPIL